MQSGHKLMDVFAVQARLVNVLDNDFTGVVLACARPAMQREGERLFGVRIAQEAGDGFDNHLLREVLAEQPLLQILLQGCGERASRGTQKRETAGLKSELGKRERTPASSPLRGEGWAGPEEKRPPSLIQAPGPLRGAPTPLTGQPPQNRTPSHHRPARHGAVPSLHRAGPLTWPEVPAQARPAALGEEAVEGPVGDVARDRRGGPGQR